jgi:hypothetical protein
LVLDAGRRKIERQKAKSEGRSSAPHLSYIQADVDGTQIYNQSSSTLLILPFAVRFLFFPPKSNQTTLGHMPVQYGERKRPVHPGMNHSSRLRSLTLLVLHQCLLFRFRMGALLIPKSEQEISCMFRLKPII